jgi:hypothetical protein
MATNYSPKIVTDGLVLCLDASDKNSYPGSGATWYDLSPNGSNGTITNAVINTESGGCFDFDGSGDYITIGDIGTNHPDWTVSCWWVSDTTNENTMFHLSSNRSQGFTVWSSANMAYYVYKSSVATHTSTSLTWSTGRWYHLTLNHTSSTNVMLTYINGAQVDSDTLDDHATHEEFDEVVIGTGGYGVWDGRIANFNIWSRVLSAAEVSQNFNAQRSRFGV